MITSQHDARTSELVAFLRDYGERSVRSLLWDSRRCMPPHVILDLARAGVLSMSVPEEYGGRPLPVSGALVVIEQLAAIDPTLASLVGVSEALGTRPLVRFGTPSTKERYLPELARGRMLAGLALTEPSAGSNPRAMEAYAERSGHGYRLHGHKSWIGNASWSGVVHAFVRVPRGEHAAPEVAGFTVSRDARGVVQGAEALTMGMRAMVQNEVRLEGVEVGDEDRLGAPGHGVDALIDTLSFGRIGIAAMALGVMQRAAQLVLRYATRRRIATGMLIDHPSTTELLGRAAGAIELTRRLVHFCARTTDRGEALEDAWSLSAKIVVPELAFEVVDGAMQRLGGRGYVETSGMPQLFRDARLFRIFEGPTEALASHLGASVMASRKDVERALLAHDRFQLARELEHHAESIRARLRDRSTGRRGAQRLASALGEWVAHALIEALCDRGSLGALLLSERRARCDARLSAAIAGAHALESIDLEGFASAIRDSIGDVEQRAAGEELALDPWLARDASSLCRA